MAKVTSKLQVTIPKELARRYSIAPGDEVDWMAGGDAIRLRPVDRPAGPSTEDRLGRVAAAAERQRQRERAGVPRSDTSNRGWTREDLYDRA